MDNELILYDRLEVIKTTNKKYDLLNNSYISFSGGKDYYKMKNYLSDSKLYHCMGDSIVVKVLEYIFGALICQTSN